MTDEEIVVEVPVEETTPEIVADAAAKETSAARVIAPQKEAESENAKAMKAIESMQRRIDELTFEKRERERQEAIKREPVKQAPTQAPTPEDFAFDDEKFRAAQAEWTQAEIDRKVAERFEKIEQERHAKDRVKTFQDREKAFAEKNPDYIDKVYRSGTVPISDDMAQEIMDSDVGPELALYLASNLDVARTLYELPTRALAKEIGRLEAKLATPVKTTPVVPKISQAPPPTPKIEVTDNASEKNPNEMSQAEFNRWRRKYI